MLNRKWMSRIVMIFSITALTAFAGIAAAKEGGGRGGKHCGTHERHNLKKMEKRLGLTDTQKTQAKAIFQDNKEVVKPLYTSLRENKKTLRSLMHAETIDEAAIRAETIKIAGTQAELNVNKAKTSAQFRAILTPSQVEKFKTFERKGHKKNTEPCPCSPTA
ncbi:MAG: hypothetical protein A2X80_04150 [Geobacteraceae bacterium GWB2_52_12]|nr:MAG: hypothetical protein A2X80_04150 [Geobacteraceae bacterium GWB2_52_12]